MTVPKGKPNQPANAEIVTVEQAIRCAHGAVHCRVYDPDDAAFLLHCSDNSDHGCGPHSYATRERIVTAWTEKPL